MKRVQSMPENVAMQQVTRGMSKHRQLSGPTEDDNDVGAGGAASKLPGKLLLSLAVPFVPVYVYALYHLFAGAVLVLYLCFLVAYFLVVAAFVAAEISICPPWYTHSTPKQGLSKHDLPDYWQGIVTDPETEFGYAYENVEFVNEAGMTLRGWWVPGEGDRWRDTAVVFCHGGGRDRRAWLRHLPLFQALGMPCLLFDLREHGISDGAGRGFTYGVRERHDVVAAARYALKRRHVVRVLLCGTSVGGASVVYAAHLLQQEGAAVSGVICENPVAHPERFIEEHMAKILGKLSPRWFWPVCRFFLFLATNVFLLRIGLFWNRHTGSASAVVRHLRVPLLVMHGTADEIVPLSHGLEIYNNAPEGMRHLWVETGAWHCALYDRNPTEFRKRILAFVELLSKKSAGLLVAVAVLVGCVAGGGMMDEEELERQMIAETSVGVTAMWGGESFVKVVAGGYFTAALAANGSVALRGMGLSRSLAGPYTDLAAGTYDLLLLDGEQRLHVLRLRDEDKEVRPTDHGEVAAFCAGFEDFEVALGKEERVEQLCCGSNYALKRLSDGRVMGRGSNTWGVLGSDEVTSQEEWVEVAGVRGATQVACGGDHAAAVVGGKAYTWGWAEMGQLGRECLQSHCSAPAPVDLSAVTNSSGSVASVFAGGYGHTGVVTSEGRVVAWGWSRHGQLGSPTAEQHGGPRLVPGMAEGVASVCSGSFKSTVAHLANGTVLAVGSNAFLQIRD